MVSIVVVTLGWFLANSNASRNEDGIVARLNLSPGEVAIVDSSTGFMCGTGLTGVATKEPTNFLNRVGAIFSPRIFERVTELELHDWRYDDGILEIVEQLPYLDSVHLRNTSITQARIAEFRKLNPNVTVKCSIDTYETSDASDPFGSIDDDNPFGPLQ